jgi:hypothetical protein
MRARSHKSHGLARAWYQLQEDAHPSYWGEKALRNCVRQAYNGGDPHGGTCTHTTTGLNAVGEPNMSFG